jgi:hypothetical protein
MWLEPRRGQVPGGYGHMRAATADRERAIDVLRAAFAEGRLTKDEFDERAGQVYRSQTYAQLAALTADLPAGPLGAHAWPQPAYPAAPPKARVNSLAIAALVCALIPGLPAAAAIVTGSIARRQIRETGEWGDGLATAAIGIGSFMVVLSLLVLAGLVG